MKDFQLYGEVKSAEWGENSLVLHTLPKTDLIAKPVTGQIIANAAFFAKPVAGDFTLRAKVSHEFLSLYDACALIAYERDNLWAKACFECSAPSVQTVVSVMTNGRSDDANGPDVEGKAVWFQLARKENTIAVHYSEDGKTYRFMRILHLPFGETIKVGLLAQSPQEKGGEFHFEEIELLEKAPENLRQGK